MILPPESTISSMLAAIIQGGSAPCQDRNRNKTAVDVACEYPVNLEVSCAADAFFIWFSGICKQQELRRQKEARSGWNGWVPTTAGEQQVIHPCRPKSSQVAVCIHVRHSRKKWAMNRLRRWQEQGAQGEGGNSSPVGAKTQPAFCAGRGKKTFSP